MDNNTIWKEIRDSCLSYSQQASLKAFTDNLGWLKYEKQVKSLKVLSPGSKVLDLGCGWGHTAAMLSSLRPDLGVIGMDLEEHPLWRQFSTKYKCKFMIGNGLSFPFKNEAFDAVVSFGVIEHVTEDLKFLIEINRVLRKEGYNIILNLPNKYALNEKLAKLLGIRAHSKKYTLSEIRDLLITAHFSITHLRREYLIPAQFYRLGKVAHIVSNKISPCLDKIDPILTKTPLNLFAGAIFVISVKNC